MKNPTKCALWNRNNLTPMDLDLELKRRFINSAYLKRNLLKCRECGQLYFHEWYEHINFKRDAFMYDTFIPVETDREIEEVSKAENSEDLTKFTPRLHGSFTNHTDETLQWITKEEPRGC